MERSKVPSPAVANGHAAAAQTPIVRPEFFGPRDNFRLSAADWHRIQELCDTIRGLRDGRADYLRQHGLAPEVHLPAHLWGQDFVPSNFAKIARKDRHTIEHLRCLTYNFTGFTMLTMAPCENTPEVLEVPPDADAIIRSVAHNASRVAVEFVRCTRGMPRDRIVQTPRLFGESGWDVDGTIVNFDTWSTQQRLNGLHHSGVLDLLQQRVRTRGYARVVEIGAGYGNLAHALKTAVGPIDYTIVDLPESLVYSTIWLSTVLADERHALVAPGSVLPAAGSGTTYLPNHMIGEFLPQLGEVDLVINTMSLSEMSSVQIAHYARIAAQLIGDGGLFYEQNYLVAGVHNDILQTLGLQFGYGALLAETGNPHRGRGEARMWSNRYRDELWNRGGITPMPTFAREPIAVLPSTAPSKPPTVASDLQPI